ncbi:NAD(+) diphosphatase [Vibrio gazogenes]|uniref:NAD-capped RNA hydrolase NudC n=1 Tax=Vibrio gazogenes DSM 21264 = NBRC 103151 TaxID=1123492 RepID=A0A1M5H6P4_VIBGA|nr:NAD(+) diphosphatase [Vibrio gazogenes]USP13504.1 NAD(+) diphosphatase [Vibrio gazogenes]SHG11566.1 NAD+ diphosphatase [Vibrio gazogenes DSM 21264] [Vibrio gazogenes DSM 21264 = NBRC 103151]
MLENSEVRNAYWCVVSGSELWTVNHMLPFGTAEHWSLPEDKAVKIAECDGHPVFWLNEADLDQRLPMSSLRTLLNVSESLFLAASKAVQYGHMTQTQRFCAQCGGRNYFHHRELAMQCHECRTIHYPRIFPCIIVAVRRDNEILLAQHARHQGGMYTVIAGFVEAGETLEQTVAREIFEETGIQVKNIRYFGSQPWAFPSSMMVAFLADYASGDILIDEHEISHASWFSPQNMPEVAPEGTIARALIEQTLADIRTGSVLSL